MCLFFTHPTWIYFGAHHFILDKLEGKSGTARPFYQPSCPDISVEAKIFRLPTETSKTSKNPMEILDRDDDHDPAPTLQVQSGAVALVRDVRDVRNHGVHSLHDRLSLFRLKRILQCLLSQLRLRPFQVDCDHSNCRGFDWIPFRYRVNALRNCCRWHSLKDQTRIQIASRTRVGPFLSYEIAYHGVHLR